MHYFFGARCVRKSVKWDKQEVLGQVHIYVIKFQAQAYNDYMHLRTLISISHRAYAYWG